MALTAATVNCIQRPLASPVKVQVFAGVEPTTYTQVFDV